MMTPKMPSKGAAARVAAMVLVALVAASAAAPPPDAENPAGDAPRDYGGKYIAEGVGAGGRAYKAMVEITRDGDTCQLLWVLSPRESYTGVGLIEGKALCVGWRSADVTGVIVYKPDGERLAGRWTAAGAEGKTFKETLTPVK